MSVQRSHRASRPTTPLRRSVSRPVNPFSSAFPLEALKPQLSEFSDALADLDTNFQYLDLMHENLARFSESFAAFLYGLEVNAWCVDFQEAPTSDSFKRSNEHEILLQQGALLSEESALDLEKTSEEAEETERQTSRPGTARPTGTRKRAPLQSNTRNSSNVPTKARTAGASTGSNTTANGKSQQPRTALSNSNRAIPTSTKARIY